jgi:hypothetical protein
LFSCKSKDYNTDYAPNDEEKAGFAKEFPRVKLPELCPIPEGPASKFAPQWLKKIHARNPLYAYYDEHNECVMLRERVEKKDGSKDFIPWTYWSDGQWRNREPGGSLPFFGFL